jgi:hypothetical protein
VYLKVGIPAVPQLSQSEQAYSNGSIPLTLATNTMNDPLPQNQPDSTEQSAGLVPPGAVQIIIASLSRRALCPRCAHLGGCALGITGLIPVPKRGGVEEATHKSKTYVEKLLECDRDGKPIVIGYRVLSSDDASRGETYMSGGSYCEYIRKSKIHLESPETGEAS